MSTDDELRAEVVVEQAEVERRAFAAEPRGEVDELGEREAELGAFAARFGPEARARRGELHAHAEGGRERAVRLVAREVAPGGVAQHVDLLGPLQDRDDVLAEQLARAEQAHHLGVLVAVAHEQRALGFEVGERGDEFGLRAAFEPVAEGLPGLQDLLDDLAQLVDLDREDALVDVPVARLADGLRNASWSRLTRVWSRS